MAQSSTSSGRVLATAGTGGLAFTSIAIATLVAARLVAAAFVEIGPDETYYWLWSQYPSAGYHDHPPMVAWWIAAGTAIFGDSPFGIRALFVLAIVPASLAVYLTGRWLFDPIVGERAALWANATILIGVGGLLATPDAPSLMFWSLAILALALVVRTGHGAWWLAVGLAAGLGVLSKLTDLFIGLGVLACLIADRRLRPWLSSGWVWAGLALAVLVLVPMLLWNAGHDWATLAKQFGRVGLQGFRPLEFPEFLVVQFGLLNPLLAVFLGLGAVMWIRGRPEAPWADLNLLGWSALPIVAYMAIHSFQEQVQGHWLAPLFPTLALIAAAAAAYPPSDRWLGFRALVFPVGAAFSLAGLVLATNPGGIVKFRWDVGQIIRGWEAVAAEAEALRAEHGAEWIATTRYVVNGELAYHLRGKTTVLQIAERERYAFMPADTAVPSGDALLVTGVGEASAFAECFAGVTPVGTITRLSGEEHLETYAAYRATGARADLLTTGCGLVR